MRGYFMFVRVWAGERDLVTILVSTMSLTYVYIYCYGYVTIHVFILVLSYLVVAEISMQILI